MANIDNGFRVEILSLDDQVLIAQGIDDPTSGAGFEAPEGSLYLRRAGTSSAIYYKTNTADVDWTVVSSGTGAIHAIDVIYDNVTSGLISTNVQDAIDELVNSFSQLSEPTGFPSRDTSEISFDDGTRTLMIQPLAPATSFDYYIHGIKFTESTARSITISNTQGVHYIYFDDTQSLHELTGSFTADLVTNYAYICALYWDVGSQTGVYVADERHGVIMDGYTHLHFHISLGTQFIDGLALGNLLVDENGSLDTYAQFSVANGNIRDEDLNHYIADIGTGTATYDLEQELNPIAQIPILYRDGVNGDWKIKLADTFPLIYSGSAGYTDGTNGLPAWNEWTGTTWQLTPVSNNHFVLVHYLATNDINHPIIGLCGVNDYQNKPQGQSAASQELAQMAGLPFEEFTPIATVIYECRSSFTNTVSATIRSSDSLHDYVDWRDVETFSSTVGGGGLTDHGNLSGLLDDDHPQYALAGSGSTRTFDLGDLLDVSTTTPTTGDVLTFDGAAWLNSVITNAQLPYLNVVTTAVNYSLTATNNVLLCTSTLDVTLPDPTGLEGKVFYIKNVGTGNITINSSGGASIDGDTNVRITKTYVSLTIITDGSNWYII